MSESLAQIAFSSIDGKPMTLGAFKGKVILIVNVASKCGLTPQYKALQAIYDRYGPQGLTIIGFPANDFGAQEPGTEAEIAAFCELNFGVSFPLASKIVVTGANKHPLYRALTEARPVPPEIQWNFEKFLLARDGSVVARFAPTMTPDDPAIVAAIEAELAK